MKNDPMFSKIEYLKSPKIEPCGTPQEKLDNIWSSVVLWWSLRVADKLCGNGWAAVCKPTKVHLYGGCF